MHGSCYNHGLLSRRAGVGVGYSPSTFYGKCNLVHVLAPFYIPLMLICPLQLLPHHNCCSTVPDNDLQSRTVWLVDYSTLLSWYYFEQFILSTCPETYYREMEHGFQFLLYHENLAISQSPLDIWAFFSSPLANLAFYPSFLFFLL